MHLTCACIYTFILLGNVVQLLIDLAIRIKDEEALLQSYFSVEKLMEMLTAKNSVMQVPEVCLNSPLFSANICCLMPRTIPADCHTVPVSLAIYA